MQSMFICKCSYCLTCLWVKKKHFRAKKIFFNQEKVDISRHVSCHKCSFTYRLEKNTDFFFLKNLSKRKANLYSLSLVNCVKTRKVAIRIFVSCFLKFLFVFFVFFSVTPILLCCWSSIFSYSYTLISLSLISVRSPLPVITHLDSTSYHSTS